MDISTDGASALEELDEPNLIVVRYYTPDLEIRGDGRTVHGLVVPYDQEATVNDGRGPYREVFRMGAFETTIRKSQGIKLKVNHDSHRLAIGRAALLREDGAGLYGEFRVSDTQEGRDAIQLIHDGVADSFSIGFTPVRQAKVAGVVERLEVSLREVSIVDFPAYAGAAISGVRNLGTPAGAADATQEPEIHPSGPEIHSEGPTFTELRHRRLELRGVTS